MNIVLFVGAIFGLSSVIMAAYVDHSLGLHVDSKTLGALLTAVKYHQLYSVIICMIGLNLSTLISSNKKKWLTVTASTFIIGIFIFSCSIYLSAMLNVREITYLTPVGGLTIMLGWISLSRVALIK